MGKQGEDVVDSNISVKFLSDGIAHARYQKEI